MEVDPRHPKMITCGPDALITDSLVKILAVLDYSDKLPPIYWSNSIASYKQYLYYCMC